MNSETHPKRNLTQGKRNINGKENDYCFFDIMTPKSTPTGRIVEGSRMPPNEAAGIDLK